VTALLTAVKARAVRPGDQLDSAGQKLTVRYVESGGNRQVYIGTVSEGGAPIVLERDPGEQMSVWRSES
jgi:hypothetical protein